MRRGLPPSIDDDITGEGRTGIFGWLLFPLLTIFAYPALTGAILLPELERARANGFEFPALLSMLTHRPSEWVANALSGNAPEAQLAAFLLALFAFLFFLVFAFRCLAALTRRSLRFPGLMRWYLLLAIPLAYFVLQLPLPAVLGTFDTAPIRGALLPLTIVMTVIWLPYFIVSKRVKNTFLKRRIVEADLSLPELAVDTATPATSDARARGFDMSDPAPRGVDGFLLVVMAALFWVPLALARELWTGETLLTRKLPLSHMFSKLAGTPSADWIALAKTNPEAVIGRVLELFGVLCAAGLIVTAVLALLALLQHARAFRRFFKWALLFSGALAIIMIALAALSGPALLPEQQMAFITSEAVGLAGSALGLIYLAVSRRVRNTFGRRRARRDVRVRSSREPVMDHEPIHAS